MYIGIRWWSVTNCTRASAVSDQLCLESNQKNANCRISDKLALPDRKQLQGVISSVWRPLGLLERTSFFDYTGRKLARTLHTTGFGDSRLRLDIMKSLTCLDTAKSLKFESFLQPLGRFAWKPLSLWIIHPFSLEVRLDTTKSLNPSSSLYQGRIYLVLRKINYSHEDILKRETFPTGLLENVWIIPLFGPSVRFDMTLNHF